MSTAKDYYRIDIETGKEDLKSRLFCDPRAGGFVDLSGVRLLNCSVDTVRQLYRGLIRPEIMCLFDKPGTLVDFAGQRWHAGRVGKDSGSQYKLQNADLGVILLIKNFNAKLENIGPHLKIEVSPHAIDAFSPERLQERLDYYASHVLTHVERNQCAVHLALDLQGWTPPADLVARMHCRARAARDISGIKEITWATKAASTDVAKPLCSARPTACNWPSTTRPNKPEPSTSSTTGKVKLPAGQATHVLRHTFASHFVMRGGNILTLQKILGHTSLAMTMRYAHLPPDHLQDALRLTPLIDEGH